MIPKHLKRAFFSKQPTVETLRFVEAEDLRGALKKCRSGRQVRRISLVFRHGRPVRLEYKPHLGFLGYVGHMLYLFF